MIKLLCCSALLVSASLLSAALVPSRAVIVLPDKPSAGEKTAAEELKLHLKQLYQVQIPVVAEAAAPGANGIFIGETIAGKAMSAGLSSQEFRLKSTGDHLIISGGSPTGTRYGVYELLQNVLGIYFLAPDCTVFPEQPLSELPVLDLRKKPAICQRDIFHGEYNAGKAPDAKRRLERFEERNRLIQDRNDRNDAGCRISYAPGTVCHSFFRYLSPKEYFATNPEYFSMTPEGVRAYLPAGQLCLSNHRVFEIVRDKMLQFIAQDRHEYPVNWPTLYDFSQEDNTDYICCCPACKAITTRYGGDLGLLLEFVNALAAAVKEKYPDVYIRTFAYNSTEKPLSGIVPADNVVIWYCDLYSRSNHQHPLTHPVNTARRELLQQWRAITPNVELWDYILPDQSRYPESTVDGIIGDAKFFKKISLNRIFVESEKYPERTQTFYELQHFLQMQLLFDPDQDAERLIGIFLNGFYGGAAPEMKEYLTLLRSEIAAKLTANMNDWHTRNLAYINVDFLSRCRAILLRAAVKAGNDSAVRGRIARELAVVDYALLRESKKDPNSAIDRSALTAEYAAMMREGIQALDDSAERKAGFLQRLEDELVMMNLKFTGLPPELADKPEEQLRFIAWPQFNYSTNGKVIADPDSTMPKSLLWQPNDPAAWQIPFGFGMYDVSGKVTFGFQIRNPKQDEKYHWVKLGRIEVGKNSLLWGGDWHVGFLIKDYYTLADGVADNPNRYDLWLSVKFTGPAYVPHSKQSNGVYIDRALLVK